MFAMRGWDHRVYDSDSDVNAAYTHLEQLPFRISYLSGFGGRQWFLHFGARSSFEQRQFGAIPFWWIPVVTALLLTGLLDLALFAVLFYLRWQDLMVLRQRHAAKGHVQAAQRAHQILINHVVHEQRNPLHVCTTSIDFIMQSLQELHQTHPRLPIPPILRDASVVQAQTERMHRLVNDLLNLSKLQARKLSITIQPTNVR